MTNTPPPAQQHGAFIVAGPTGVGKSEFAAELAERCGGEVVSADAFQVYQGLKILTAQPSAAARAREPHHLIGVISLQKPFHVGRYLELAAPVLAEIRARGRQPIIVGGTGLYVRALLRGLDPLPAGDASLREELSALAPEERRERLRHLDPDAAAQIDVQNPRRVLRALEVCLLTGRPFSSFREQWRQPLIPQPMGLVLERDREELYARIDERVDEMFRAGVVEEVRNAGALGATAEQTLGVSQIRRLLQGEWSEQECRAAIQQATRRYAKRQLTWWRREPALKPFRGGIEEFWPRRGEFNFPAASSSAAVA